MKTGLIVTVGTSWEPVAFGIQERAPDAVGFLLTDSPECMATFATVLEKTGLGPIAYRDRMVKDSPDAIGALIGHFYDLHAWLRDPAGGAVEHVACDPTAGRKWMSAGLSMIASRLGLDMFYVDVRYPGGKLDPSSMKSVPLGNAYEQTGFLDALHARDLFNDGLFAEARKLFGRLASTASGTLRPALYEGFAHLSEGLHRMDLFEHYARDLSPVFKEACRKLEAVKEERPAWNDEPLKAGLRLAESVRDLYAPANPEEQRPLNLVIFRCADLVSNAERRIRRGRYDDAVARLYRCFEALAQAKLHEYGLDATHPQAGYARLAEEQRQRLLAAGLPSSPWALDTGWKALYLMGDPWAREIVVAKLNEGGRVIYKKSVFGAVPGEAGQSRTGLEARNRSILAHGWEPIGEAMAQRFHAEMESLLRKVAADTYTDSLQRLAPPMLARECVLL